MGKLKATFTSGCPVYFPIRLGFSPKQMEREVESFANRYDLTIADIKYVPAT